MIKRRIRKLIFIIANFALTPAIFYNFHYRMVCLLPQAKLRDHERFPLILYSYQAVFSLARHIVNKKSLIERERLAQCYLIPAVNILFDKNYVNYAQFLLLILEEYFLSKKTETEFEVVLATFSKHAVAAGLRFREAFPLPPRLHTDKLTLGLVGHAVAISGYEVVMGLGSYMAPFTPRMYAMRLFETSHGPTTAESFHKNGIELILTGNDRYDVFDLRKLLIERPVDVAVWPMPPFHMFFLFAFGLSSKQVWFSQYLRPNIAFEHLDGLLTPGGAGQLTRKTYNGREWHIIPQIADIAGIMDSIAPAAKDKILFTPARLEKLKQLEFMECVAEILLRDPCTHFQWTGYYKDSEVMRFFKERGLASRHTYLPWMDAETLRYEISKSDMLLACFPLSLGTVENIATHYGVPVISMFDEEFNLYWRDIYWEATNGNETLKRICLDEFGNSRILIAKTQEEYINVALRVLRDPKLTAMYVEIYRETYAYTYHQNPNDIGKIFDNFIHTVYKDKEIMDAVV